MTAFHLPYGVREPALLLWLERVLRQPLRSRDVLVVSLPAPLVALEPLVAAAPLEGSFLWDSVLWEDGRGDACVGWGAAFQIRGRGPGRFQELRRGLADAQRRIVHRAHPASGAPTPRFFGGAGFFGDGPSTVDRGPWHGFEGASFVLPEITYGRLRSPNGPFAYLTCAWTAETWSDPGRRREAVTRVAELLGGRLWSPTTVSESSRAVAPVHLAPVHLAPVHPERDRAEARAWTDRVHDLTREIHRGRFEKVVAARGRRLALGSAPSVDALLARAAGSGVRASGDQASGDRASGDGRPAQFRFAFGRRDRLFFGLTPERLVRLRGLHVRTEALAGTAEGDGRDLASSAKDLREHRLVVEAVRRSLEPLCSSLVLAAAPETHRLGRVAHLRTPIHGRLRRPVSVLETAAALHPTPAVGGTPRGDALRWIREHEGDRGWYASPVGWVDLDGDGELAVALRCGLLHAPPSDRCELWTFAGAGIVAGSDPVRELAEIRLKERSFLSTFGFEEST